MESCPPLNYPVQKHSQLGITVRDIVPVSLEVTNYQPKILHAPHRRKLAGLDPMRWQSVAWPEGVWAEVNSCTSFRGILESRRRLFFTQWIPMEKCLF